MTELQTCISEIGVVPVIKLNHPQRDAVALAKALCAGRVPVAEVTFRAAGAADAIRLMKEAVPEMIVGAGTVLTTAQIDEALAAGAQFIVTPGMDPDLVRKCFLESYTSAQQALDDAFAVLGPNATVLAMPYGGSTLPIVEQ